MELFLNLAGALVAVLLVGLWLRWAPVATHDKRTQLIALALLILILFPVISVTDDLVASQNPAETDSLQRRDHVIECVSSTLQVVAWLPEPPLAELPVGIQRLSTPDSLQVLVLEPPSLAPIENRPPPTA